MTMMKKNKSATKAPPFYVCNAPAKKHQDDADSIAQPATNMEAKISKQIIVKLR